VNVCVASSRTSHQDAKTESVIHGANVFLEDPIVVHFVEAKASPFSKTKNNLIGESLGKVFGASNTNTADTVSTRFNRWA
jgi:hypothetical protein